MTHLTPALSSSSSGYTTTKKMNRSLPPDFNALLKDNFFAVHSSAPVSSGPTSSSAADDLNHHHNRMSPVGEKNGVQELRKIISMYLAHVYHGDEKRMGKRKMKNLWDKAPDDWPENIPFVDPNNGLKEENGKQLKPKKHDLVPMYNFLRQKYEESISGSQSIIPANAMRGSFIHESTCNQTVPEQGQTTIPTHSTPTIMATTYMGPNQSIAVFSDKLSYQQQLLTDSPTRMTSEVTEQAPQSLMDDSELYGYKTLEEKPKEGDIEDMMKTYKVSSADDFQNLKDMDWDQHEQIGNVTLLVNNDMLLPMENKPVVDQTFKFYHTDPPDPDILNALSFPKMNELPRKFEYMDCEMDVDTENDIVDKMKQGNSKLEHMGFNNNLIPDFSLLLGDKNKPRR